MPKDAPTLVPGMLNGNGQMLIRRTGTRSTTREGQSVVHLRCGACGLDYGANGIDVHHRRCPGCQGGMAGEPLQTGGTMALFEMGDNGGGSRIE